MYTADYEQMAKFVDALIAQKYPGEPAENYQSLREELISQLSDQIDAATFDKLTKDQQQEFNQLAESDNSDDALIYLGFFEKLGLDFGEIVKDAMVKFGTKFLGGSANE